MPGGPAFCQLLVGEVRRESLTHSWHPVLRILACTFSRVSSTQAQCAEYDLPGNELYISISVVFFRVCATEPLSMCAEIVSRELLLEGVFAHGRHTAQRLDTDAAMACILSNAVQ